MNLNVFWKNHGVFKITISGEKTLLDLKKEIANYCHKNYNGLINYTNFNILNGNFIHDSTCNSKTLIELKIARVIRLPVNFNPAEKQD